MLQEPHLSQGLPKAPPIPGAPHLVPTNPCSMGARHKAGGGSSCLGVLVQSGDM